MKATLTMMMPDSNPKAPNTRSGGEWLEEICQNGTFLPPLNRASETFTDGSDRGTSRSVIQPKHRANIPDNAIRDELARIMESSIFVQSERLGHFLRFTVETTLDGKAETLKE